MTTKAMKVLNEFDRLDEAERTQVAVEIIRRSSEGGELTDAALVELAAGVFDGYDAEESARAGA